MSFRRMLALAIRIIRQFLHGPRTLALLFIAPLVVLVLLYLILSQTTSTVVLALAPQDAAAQTLAGTIQARAPAQAGVQVRLLSPAEATDQLKRGDVDGVLAIICPSTSAAACAPTLTLTLEGSNPATAQQLSNVVTLLLTGLPSQGTTGGPSTPPALPVSTHYLYGGPDYTVTDAIAPYLISFFSFFLIFLLTAVAFLRERSQGTMERVLVSPLRWSELVVGYILGFTLFALLQALLILLFVILVLKVHEQGNLALLFLVTALSTLGGLSLGIFVSEFSRNESEIGRALYTSLFALLRLQGLYSVYAGITLPNPASVALHERMGMRPVGVYHQVGYKLGAWHDVGWWQGTLQPYSYAPVAPLSLSVAQTLDEWDAALENGTVPLTQHQ